MVMLVSPAVSSSAARIWARSRSETRGSARSPRKRPLTPNSCNSSRRRVSRSSLKPMRNSTSSAGRFQFSVEKVNTVSHSIPRPRAPWTTSNNASSPAACPAVRGRPRAVAQRPLPSITIATWRGSAIDDQRYKAPLQVVLDEPPGHPHGLPGEPGIGGGEGGEVGGGDARQVADEPGAQGDRTRDLIVLAQHSAPGTGEPGQILAASTSGAVIESRGDP